MPREYIIVDIESKRYLGQKGWVTDKKYARQLQEKELHDIKDKLRKKHFLKISFEEVEISREDKKLEARKELVKTAVKRSINEMKSIVETAEKAQTRLFDKPL